MCVCVCVCVRESQMGGGGGGGNSTIFTEFSTQLSEMFMILNQRTNLAISLVPLLLQLLFEISPIEMLISDEITFGETENHILSS